jgi:spore germination protein KC
MRAKMPFLLTACLILSLILTGCWNSRELNDLAIVSGIGIDQTADNGEFRITFQIVNPSASSTSMGSGNGMPAVTVFSASDRTIFGALRKASKRATRQLFFAHSQLVVVGESLARSGIEGLFDIFERSHELRLNSPVLISRNSDAASVLKILTTLESLPSMGVVKKMQNTSRVYGENRNMNVFEIINGITGEGDLTINGLRLIGDPSDGMKKSSLEQSETKAGTIMSGLGVFKDDKLIYWMDGPAARGTQWVLNKVIETNIDIASDDKEEDTAVNVFYSKTSVKVEVKNGIPVFHLHIREEGIVNETGSYVDLSLKEEIVKLEAKLEEKTKAEVELAIRTAQASKTDIFGFGNELKRTDPAVWEKVGKEWSTAFAQGELDIQVEAYIRSTGMRLKPYMAPEKE